MKKDKFGKRQEKRKKKEKTFLELAKGFWRVKINGFWRVKINGF